MCVKVDGVSPLSVRYCPSDSHANGLQEGEEEELQPSWHAESVIRCRTESREAFTVLGCQANCFYGHLS